MGNFRIEKGKYMDDYADIDNTGKKINDIINSAFNINIEKMTDQEIQNFVDVELKKVNKNLYDNCIKSLVNINNHLSMLIAASNKNGGYIKNLLGNYSIYDELAIMADRISDVISTLFVSIPREESYFNFNEYKTFVLPLVNKFLSVVKQIEYRNGKVEKIPLNIYTTNSYFKGVDIIFKIEYTRVVVSKNTVLDLSKYLYQNIMKLKNPKFKSYIEGVSGQYLQILDYERVIKNSTPGRIFVKELFQGGVLNEVIDIATASNSKKDFGKKLEVTSTLVTSAATKGTAHVALKAAQKLALDADNAKKSINIFTKLTGTAKKSAIIAAEASVKSKGLLIAARGAQVANVVSGVLVVGDIGVGGYRTYQKSRLLHRLEGIFGIDEQLQKMECNNVYRHYLN